MFLEYEYERTVIILSFNKPIKNQITNRMYFRNLKNTELGKHI
jgi:hypothetical protein